MVDGEMIDAGRQDAEVPAVQNGKIPQDHAPAVFQRDGLVADPVEQRVVRLG